MRVHGSKSWKYLIVRFCTRGRILGRNWDKSRKSFPPCYSHSSLLMDFIFSPHPLTKSSLKLFCNANIVYGNLKSENSQDYAQKPQRNCTFMNSAPVPINGQLHISENEASKLGSKSLNKSFKKMMNIGQKRPGPEAQFVVPDLVIKLTMTQCFRNGLSSYVGLVGRYNNPMPLSTLSPCKGLWIWLHLTA